MSADKEAVEAARHPVPEGVWYCGENANFYSVERRRGMGMAFWMKWRNRRNEFPGDPSPPSPAKSE